MRFKPLIIVCMLLLAPTMAPNSDALITSGGFTTTTITGLSDSFAALEMASAGQAAGIFGKYAASGEHVFLWNDGTGWLIKTEDALGAGVNFATSYRLTACSPTEWFVFGDVGATAEVYRSVDSGGTWTLVHTATTAAFQGDIKCNGAGHVGIIYTDADGDTIFQKTTDDFASIGAAIDISDNRGSPAATGTTWIRDTKRGNSLAVAGDSWTASFWGRVTGSSDFNGRVFNVFSTDGGFFWTVPFTTAIGLPPADGGTVEAPKYTCSQGSSWDKVRATATAYSTVPWVIGGVNGCQASTSFVDIVSGAPVAGEQVRIDSTPVSDNCANYEAPGIETILFEGNLYVLAGRTTTRSLHRWDGTTTNPSTVGGFPFPAVNNCVMAMAITSTTLYMANLNSASGGQLAVTSGTVATIADAVGSVSWCSNPDILDYAGDGPDGPGDDDFGYNYVEDVTFTRNPIGVSDTEMENAYVFDSDSTDLAYMAKGWTGLVTDVRAVFRIEASVDALDSIITFHFSFESGQNPPSSTTKGNGVSTAAFTTYIAAKFVETGNKWNIGLTYRNGLTGPIGASVLAYSPNEPHIFSFRLNTTGAGYAQIIDEETDTPIITQVLSTSGLAGVSALSGGDPISSLWIVTGGSGAIINSLTFLDDPSDDTLLLPSDSSCIFFQPPAVLFGSPGVSPPSQAPNPDDIDGDGIPNEFDVDIDGDGLCNDDDVNVTYPPGTPGAETGCVGGDLDDDGDRILDIFDTTPRGPSSGPPAVGLGTGLLAVSATNAVYYSLGTILLLATLGWALVTGRGRRDG